MPHLVFVFSSEPKLCGLDCQGRGGSPPSLHCEVCMCLFHPECVGYDRTKRDGFTCKVGHIMHWHHFRALVLFQGYLFCIFFFFFIFPVRLVKNEGI